MQGLTLIIGTFVTRYILGKCNEKKLCTKIDELDWIIVKRKIYYKHIFLTRQALFVFKQICTLLLLLLILKRCFSFVRMFHYVPTLNRTIYYIFDSLFIFHLGTWWCCSSPCCILDYILLHGRCCKMYF